MVEEHALSNKRPAQVIKELEKQIQTLEAEIDLLHVRSNSFMLKTIGSQKSYKSKLLQAANTLEQSASDMGDHVWIPLEAFQSTLEILRSDNDDEFDYH